MNNIPELIVMLTYNDCTANNAYEIFDKCKNSQAKYWGFKEYGLPLDIMKKLYNYMKLCGKTTVLEVVAYTEEECLKCVMMGIKCNIDILMGTMYFDSINELCKKHNIKYMPFIGKVYDRPSILDGNINDMINEANYYLNKGVYGIDLLGYRYTKNPLQLNMAITNYVDAPICIAGSINSYERLDEVKSTNAKFFTIGSAFFDNKFDGTFEEQINKVYTYTKKPTI